MLILTRRIGESLHAIHPDGTLIVCTILGVRGNQVRLGVEAPKTVVVHRKEIMDRILDQNNGSVPGTLYLKELTDFNQ